MTFWLFMLVMDLLIPLTMIFFGKYFKETAPKTIQAIFGYRSTMSMKNNETWVFAHHYCGRLWYRFGLCLLPISLIVMILVKNETEQVIGLVGALLCGIQLIFLVGSIFPTEKALKRNFNEEGKRRI